ncbi:MAG TPA: hypothetical protein VLB29_09600 [Nocardioidaceae bacterium]|nr:hypothetical protein [Nocardioidaceae bacterium]
MCLRGTGLVGVFLLLASVLAVPGAAAATDLVDSGENYLGRVSGPAAALDSLSQVNARGDAAVAFARDGILYVRSRPAGGSWRRAERVATDVNPAALTVDGKGRATVFWLDGPMWVRSQTRDGWTRKRALPGGEASSNLSADQNDDGDLAAMYLTSTGLHLAYRSGSGRWRTDQVLFRRPVQGLSLRVSLDERGRATVTWVQARVREDVLRGARSGPRGLFGPSQVLSPAGGAVTSTDLDVNDAGTAAVAWVQDVGGRDVTLVRSRTASGSWRPPRVIAPEGRDPRVATGPAGEVWVVWESRAIDEHAVLMVRRPAGGGWSEPATIVDSPSTISLAEVTAAEDGSAVVTYRDASGDPTSDRLWFAYTPRITSDFSAPQAVPHPGRFGPYSVSMSATGDALMTLTSRIGPTGTGRARMAAGPDPESHLWAVVLDTTGPVVRMSLPSSAFARSRLLRVRWTGSDVWSEIAGYRLFGITWAADATDRQVIATTHTTRTTADFLGTNGRTYCFEAEATDTAGNAGRRSRKRCTAVPFDDRNLRRDGNWRKVHSSGSYRDTVLRSSRRGSTLSKKVSTRRLALLATRCPGCGEVAVYIGSRLLERISLDAPTVARQVRIPVARFPRPQRGRVRIVVKSSGRPVSIDGLATSVR